MYNYREAVKNDVMDYMESELREKFSSVEERQMFHRTIDELFEYMDWLELQIKEMEK